MAGNVLQFMLGLATGNFLSAMGGASSAVKGFLSATFSLGAVAGGVLETIGKGAALQALSRRTSESVRSLYLLEKGFKAAQIPAEGLPQTLLMMQKALGGFNEMGEPTKDIFSGLRLDVEELKRLDAPTVLAKIGERLAGLNKNEAATAAGKIFGRFGAGDMLQLSRSMKEFQEGMEHASPKADLFARNAAGFAKLSRELEYAKSKVKGFFAGIAEGAAPALDRILEKVNGNQFLAKAGEAIGKILEALERGWEEGKFGEVVALTLEGGFEKAVNMFARMLQAVFAAVPGMMAAALGTGGALGHGLKSAYFAFMAENFTGAGAGQMAEEFRGKSMVELGKANLAMDQIWPGVAKAINDALGAKTHDVFSGGALAKLDEMLKRPGRLGPGVPGDAGDGLVGNFAGERRKHRFAGEVSGLQRVGFDRLLGGSDALAHARATAQNTKTTANMVTKMSKMMEKFPFVGSPSSFANV